MDKVMKPFYGTKAWKRCRSAVLIRDHGMCVDCVARFQAGYGIRPRRATMVHHIIPYEERPDLALNMKNLVSLCADCHAKRHPEKGGRGRSDTEKEHKMRIIKV